MRFQILLLASLCSCFMVAQNSIDLLTISGRYGMPMAYDAPQEGEKGTETALLINAKAPIVFSKKTIWYNNITYTRSHVSNNLNLGEGLMNPITLNGFILQTGLVQRIDEKNAIQLLYVPRYMSDFQGSSPEVWQHGAIVLYEHRWSSTFMMRFGMMYNQERAGPLLVPLFDFNWQMTQKWSMVGLFPIYLKINYHVNERFTVGVSHFGLITSYALHGEGYAGDYMERTAIDISLFGRWKMAGNCYLEGRLGYAFGRTYAQYAADDKIDLRLSIIKFGDNRPEPKNILFQDGPIANLRLVYNIPLTN
jgi:hypothetical protein